MIVGIGRRQRDNMRCAAFVAHGATADAAELIPLCAALVAGQCTAPPKDSPACMAKLRAATLTGRMEGGPAATRTYWREIARRLGCRRRVRALVVDLPDDLRSGDDIMVRGAAFVSHGAYTRKLLSEDNCFSFEPTWLRRGAS